MSMRCPVCGGNHSDACCPHLAPEEPCGNCASLESELAEAEARQVRLSDLVRHQRNELHESGLISDDEFESLVQLGKASVARLESYDKLRSERDAAVAEAERLRIILDGLIAPAEIANEALRHPWLAAAIEAARAARKERG